MSADRDSGGHDPAADSVKITETHSAAGEIAYDVDPDTENYAAGNDPETAYRNHGRPDSPNSWSDYADTTDEKAALEGKDLESPTIAAREDDRQGADASDAIYAYLSRAVLEARAPEDVISDGASAARLAIIVAQRATVVYRPDKDKGWWDYLDLIETAIEVASALDASVLPAAVMRAYLPKPTAG
ncbi:MAG: hypothetical protein JO345_23770 [Streptosporangiaceae bacterium]|nr:hypothetical protein [Streptosporangiaceae bacterium]